MLLHKLTINRDNLNNKRYEITVNNNVEATSEDNAIMKTSSTALCRLLARMIIDTRANTNDKIGMKAYNITEEILNTHKF